MMMMLRLRVRPRRDDISASDLQLYSGCPLTAGLSLYSAAAQTVSCLYTMAIGQGSSRVQSQATAAKVSLCSIVTKIASEGMPRPVQVTYSEKLGLSTSTARQ